MSDSLLPFEIREQPCHNGCNGDGSRAFYHQLVFVHDVHDSAGNPILDYHYLKKPTKEYEIWHSLSLFIACDFYVFQPQVSTNHFVDQMFDVVKYVHADLADSQIVAYRGIVIQGDTLIFPQGLRQRYSFIRLDALWQKFYQILVMDRKKSISHKSWLGTAIAKGLKRVFFGFYQALLPRELWNEHKGQK